MDGTTQSTGLQQTGVNALSTGDPQQNVQGGLQPQAQTNLQPSSNQSVDSINALDQGSQAINLATVTNTTSATVQVAPTPRSTTSTLIYSGIFVLCAAFLVYMAYDLLRHRS